MENKNQVVTRLSPSPTGSFIHIGNVRTMLYNYFLAKSTGGKFLIRLEDTDRDRFNPNFIDYLKETLDWLGIIPDESPWNPNPNIGSYVQSERDYSEKIKFLLDNGFAYYAFDTKEDLDVAHKTIKNFKYDSVSRINMKNSFTLSKEEVENKLKNGDRFVIRFDVKPNIDVTINDSVLGDIIINSSTLDDKVLMKSDGIPSYHMANVCDDHDMFVTHVLRGQEWVNSTPFHILLYKSFGWTPPTFAHLPLIMNPDGKGKLSKRNAAKYGIPIAPIQYMDENGDTHKGWRELGYSKEAFINFVSLIGWHPSGDNEIVSIDDMIKDFKLSNVVKHGARLTMDKALFINSEYLKKTPKTCLLSYIKTKYDVSNYSDHYNDKIIDICLDRSNFMVDMLLYADIFYSTPNTDKVNVTDDFNKVFTNFVENVDVVWEHDSIKEFMVKSCSLFEVKMGKIMPDLRNCLTGGVSGPDLATTMEVLGKSETLKRISKCLKVSG